MPVRNLEPGENLGLDRGSAAIVIPVATPLDLVFRCIRSVVAHSPPDVPLLIVDSAPTDPDLERFLSDLDRDTAYMCVRDASGTVELANAGLAACASADTALVASHALVFEGWLERLCAAGRSDSTVGTAGALGNNTGILSVADPYAPIPGDADLQRWAADIAAASPRARPTIPVADGHCVWISRAAMDLAGPLDPAFKSLRAATIDFGARSLSRGLLNVAADDVFVASVLPGLSAHGGPLSVGEDRPLLERRHPHLRRALDEPVSLPLGRSLSAARRALHRLSVTIDGRILRGDLSGAQAETLELIEALHRTQEVELRVLLDPALGADARAALDRIPGVARLYPGEEGPPPERSDVVHRPFQVTSAADLEVLAAFGERVVITHLDLIGFHNPGYFESFEGWWQYRRLTRQALALADRVIFLSEHAARDAVHEELVEPDRARVMPMAVNRDRPVPELRRPLGFGDGPFLLCIGNDFRHKNRAFAIELLAALRARSWDGRLVLAGAHMGHGSSRGDEAALLAGRPDLATAVVELPAVAEAEKSWLFANAAAVVYPTVYEGFGLIPFEAAFAGVPCLFAPQASLGEMLPAEAAVLVPWDPDASAERALPLLRDEEERRRHIELIGAAASRRDSWESIGSKLIEAYEEVSRSPYREAASLAAEAARRENELSKWIGLEENMGELVGPESYLPADVQRALLAAATRRRLRGPLFALLRAAYRIGHRKTR